MSQSQVSDLVKMLMKSTENPFIPATNKTYSIQSAHAQEKNFDEVITPEIISLPTSPPVKTKKQKQSVDTDHSELFTKMYEQQFTAMTSRLSLLNSTNFETWKLNIDDVHAIKALTIISKINVKLHQPVSNAGECLLCLNKTRKDAPRLWKKEVECLLCKTRGYKNFTFRTQLELITHNTGKLHQIDHTLQKLTETKCPVHRVELNPMPCMSLPEP